jgi:hypothetical protein
MFWPARDTIPRVSAHERPPTRRSRRERACPVHSLTAGPRTPFRTLRTLERCRRAVSGREAGAVALSFMRANRTGFFSMPDVHRRKPDRIGREVARATSIVRCGGVVPLQSDNR